MGGFWPRLEQWLVDLQRDRLRMARYFQIAYWISMLMVLFGFVVGYMVFTGRWAP